jgi:dihydrofolate reductase
MIKAIVATSLDGVIGIGADMPWHLPADFKHFKETTMGQAIVMGRTTYDSIANMRPGKEVLPGRMKYVLTSKELPIQPDTRAIFLTDPASFITKLGERHETVFIGGGAQIYSIFNGMYDEVIRTLVNTEFTAIAAANAVYSPIKLDGYTLTNEHTYEADEKNKFSFVIETWKKNT